LAKSKKKSPEQLKDDDDRTTSMGLFITAEAYRHSAMVLEKKALWRAPERIGHAEKPVQFLYTHALELYLKALLRTKYSIDAVEDFRHSIKRLVKEAQELGLVVTPVDRDLFAIMADTNALIEMRYIRTGSKTVRKVVEIENLHRTCKSVRDSVGGLLREAGIVVPL
jgi:HEPN domain-containing protein